ncbi:MAG: HAMP domain-containing histidine kinase [Deltaproteobacteria bacterium]|nr:HAMP domain-containing histidine kinase [Deltaproteobacteria bacterium]
MNSLRARLTVALVGVVAGVLVALALALYVGVQDAAWQQKDHGLQARAHALAAGAENEDEGVEIELPALPDGFAEVWVADKVISRSAGWNGDLPARAGRFDLTLPDGRPGRAFGLHFAPRDEQHRPPVDTLIVLAEGTDDIAATVATVRTRFLLLGGIALLLVGGVTAWLLARGLAPLAALRRDLANIDAGRLATRLPVDGQPSELAAPVRTLNDLLARLESAFSREREFTSDVSHELRTPLAGLRTLLEVSRKAPTPTDIEQALAITLQMCALVENLLMLARVDAGQLAVAKEPVALRTLVEECWRPHAEVAAKKQVALRNELPDVTVTTDREKLRVVVGNLLSNAAEYTEAGGWIAISKPAGALIEVADSGPPIPPDALPKIFERMWRADTARSATGVHCGIGLSLARSLADALGMQLVAATHADGSVHFVVSTAST